MLGAVSTSATPPLPAGVALANIRGVRVTFTAAPVVTPTDPADVYRIRPGTNFPTTGACTNASACFAFVPRIDLRSAPGTLVPDILTNTASGGYESRAQPVDVLAPIPPTQATHTLTSGTGQLQFSKTPDRTAAPGEGIPFVLRAANTGTGTIRDLTIVEPVPAGLDFAPLDPNVPYDFPPPVLPGGAPDAPTPEFTQVTDPATGRVTSLRWVFHDWPMVPGSVVRIQVRMVLAPGVVAGQEIENRAGATGSRPDLSCNLNGVPRSGQAVDDDVYGTGRYCTSAAVVTTGEGNAFRTQKWVAGDPALGWLNTLTGAVVPVDDPACPVLALGVQHFTRYPCVGRVLPGNGFDFFLQLVNAGTNPATEVRVIDVFPHPGDTGVLLTGQSRGTQWTQSPTLLTPVVLTGKGSADIGYATGAACTTDLGPAPAACAPGAWGGGFSAGAAAFRAIITFPPNDRLQPGQSTGLRFRMDAPPNPASATDEVAWNSFAHTEFFQSGTAVAQLPATEPIKVGIAIVYGGLTITKTVVDPSGGSAGLDFDIDYDCTVIPERGGDPVSVASGTVTVAAGSSAQVAGVPAGATCEVWEPDARGLVSNAPDRATALTIGIDATAVGSTAAIVNSAPPPETTTTTTTVAPAPGETSTTTTTTAVTTTTSDLGAGGGAAGNGSAGAGAGGGTLPATGASSMRLVAMAMVLVGLGILALSLRRRSTN